MTRITTIMYDFLPMLIFRFLLLLSSLVEWLVYISKVWQYFGKMLHNLAPLDAFVSHEGDETHWTRKRLGRLIFFEFYLSVLPLHLGAQPQNLSFWLIWPYQIVEVLTTREKFLEPSGYCDQQYLYFSHNKYFCLLLSHLDLVWTHNTYVPD